MVKQTHIWLLGLVLSFGLISCSKYLDLKPKDFLSPTNFYQSESDFESAAAAVYDNLGSGNLYANRSLIYLGLEADEGYWWRTGIENGVRVNNFTASDIDLTNYWIQLYIGIARANSLLKNVDPNAVDLAPRIKEIRGEVLFLRAYSYFLLVQSFGDVPLILEPAIDPNLVEVPRTNARVVYKQIIEDMTEAEGLVGDIKSIGFGGRVSKSAVRGILARVCLHFAGNPYNESGMYELARTWASKVIDDVQAGHKLNEKYSDVFINYAQDKYDINESIWELEFWGNRGDGYSEAGFVSSYLGPRSDNATTGIAYGGVKVTGSLYNLYKEGDDRKYWAIAHFFYSATGANGAKSFSYPANNAAIYNLYVGKYRREYELVIPKGNQFGPNNLPLLRFSDVLLMYAEAENEISGPTEKAVNYVNEIRKRSWSTGVKSITITNGGSGYTSVPTVVFGSGNAQAVATISGGKVTKVTLAMDDVTGYKRGSKYATPPAISFVGGGGSGATAVADIYHVEDAMLTTGETASKENFRKFLQDERARELCFETLRKHDLIRWGIYVSQMHKTADQIKLDANGWFEVIYRRVEEKHNLWPIPTYERTLNRALTQNPGW